MVEITPTEQNIEETKDMKRAYKTSGTTLNAPTFTLEGSQEEKREIKDMRKYLKR